MEKLIIENRTDIPWYKVLAVITEIVEAGRISGKNNDQYCYLTSYEHDGKQYHFVSDKNKKSDRFTVYEVER